MNNLCMTRHSAWSVRCLESLLAPLSGKAQTEEADATCVPAGCGV